VVELLMNNQTRPLEDICNLPVQDITDKEAVLFLWATTPLLQEGLDVMKAWGFEYKSLVIWDKVRPFTGNYFSVQQEFLLLGTKGSCLPDCNERPHSIIRVEKGRHSEKPEEFRRLIEQMYKYGNKVESSYLLANKKRAGRSMEMNWKSNQQIPNHLAFDRFVETFGVDLDKLKQRPEGADRASRRYYKSQRKGGSNPDTQLSLFSEATTTSGS
jgi:N6-adenosine-specific RNA methylase IME4